MSSISTAREKAIGDSAVKPGGYLTTTELARLCGVSRFSIINWINEGKIGAVKTFGGHRRIPVVDAITFLRHFRLETVGKGEKTVASGPLGHCWEYRQKMSHRGECGNCRDCLVYGKELDWCFVVVRQFGKKTIRSKGDCLSCPYFDELFRSYGRGPQPQKPRQEKSKEAAAGKRHFLKTFAYIVGRGVHELKQTVARTRDRLASRWPRAREKAAERAVRREC